MGVWQTGGAVSPWHARGGVWGTCEPSVPGCRRSLTVRAPSGRWLRPSCQVRLLPGLRCRR